MKVMYFKSGKRSNRFNLNQKVWISRICGNHLDIFYKYRGKGRYVRGTINLKSPCISKILMIDVEEGFGNRITRGLREDFEKEIRFMDRLNYDIWQSG